MPGVEGAIQVSVDAGPCAVHADGTVVCWGGDTQGAPFGPRPLPLRGPARKIAGGKMAGACALLESGAVECFRGGVYGPVATALCARTTCPSRMPLDGVSDAVDIDIALEHGCVLRRNGVALCWGFGAAGDNSNYVDNNSLTAVATTLSFVQLSADTAITCAVTTEGHVACWGDLRSRTVASPQVVPGLDSVVQVIAYSRSAGPLAFARRADGSIVGIHETRDDFRVETVTR